MCVFLWLCASSLLSHMDIDIALETNTVIVVPMMLSLLMVLCSCRLHSSSLQSSECMALAKHIVPTHDAHPFAHRPSVPKGLLQPACIHPSSISIDKCHKGQLRRMLKQSLPNCHLVVIGRRRSGLSRKQQQLRNHLHCMRWYCRCGVGERCLRPHCRR